VIAALRGGKARNGDGDVVARDESEGARGEANERERESADAVWQLFSSSWPDRQG
jgi:hypothetical protein